MKPAGGGGIGIRGGGHGAKLDMGGGGHGGGGGGAGAAGAGGGGGGITEIGSELALIEPAVDFIKSVRPCTENNHSFVKLILYQTCHKYVRNKFII